MQQLFYVAEVLPNLKMPRTAQGFEWVQSYGSRLRHQQVITVGCYADEVPEYPTCQF